MRTNSQQSPRVLQVSLDQCRKITESSSVEQLKRTKLCNLDENGVIIKVVSRLLSKKKTTVKPDDHRMELLHGFTTHSNPRLRTI